MNVTYADMSEGQCQNPRARVASIRAEALRQIAAEDFNARVAAEKVRIREHRPFWHRIFPFVITIRRR